MTEAALLYESKQLPEPRDNYQASIFGVPCPVTTMPPDTDQRYFKESFAFSMLAMKTTSSGRDITPAGPVTEIVGHFVEPLFCPIVAPVIARRRKNPTVMLRKGAMSITDSESLHPAGFGRSWWLAHRPSQLRS